jgi:hypothetical protein
MRFKAIGVVALVCAVCSCGKENGAGDVKQTSEGVVIDTSQFSLQIPGVWEEEPWDELDSKLKTLFVGTADNRQVIISGVTFASSLDDGAQIEIAQEIIDAARGVEQDGLNGRGVIIPEAAHVDEDDGRVWGGYTAVDGQSGRLVFHRLLCHPDKALNVYYAAWGFDGKPDAAAIADEFSAILETVRFK